MAGRPRLCWAVLSGEPSLTSRRPCTSPAVSSSGRFTATQHDRICLFSCLFGALGEGPVGLVPCWLPGIAGRPPADGGLLHRNTPHEGRKKGSGLGGLHTRGTVLSCAAQLASGCPSVRMCACVHAYVFHSWFKVSLWGLLAVWPSASFLNLPGLSFCICEVGLLL